MSRFPVINSTTMAGIVSTPKSPQMDITMADITKISFIPTTVQPFHYESLILSLVTLLKPIYSAANSAVLSVPVKNSEIAAKRALITNRVKAMSKSILTICGTAVVCFHFPVPSFYSH